MQEEAKVEKYQHRLSPSAWNRFETCPRQYWLSKQKLPRKASMPASLGTAVHASIEDLLNMDLSGKNERESGWLLDTGYDFLRQRWEEEKAIFLATPRRGDWKDEKFSEAKLHHRGGIYMLLDHLGINGLDLDLVTVALWRKLQSLVLAVEGELVTRDGRLMGRLDLLLANLDGEGNINGWTVADLKTGRIPEGSLKEEVNRQLCMYRDILKANNTEYPEIITQGWYTKDASKWKASGANVLEDALSAWESTLPTKIPLEPKIGENSCGGFCDWKAWCPHWLLWRSENGTLHKGDFADAVIQIVEINENGSGIAELCVPADANGKISQSGQKVPISFKGRGLDALNEARDKSPDGPLFIGSALTKGRAWNVGHWCDVLPYQPIPDGSEYEPVQD